MLHFVTKSSPLDRKAILIVGMHRSGTSMLSHTINLMGAFVGEERDLIAPNPSLNPKGYWERGDIVAAHDRFFQDNGYGWASVSGFALENISEDRRRRLADALRGIVGGMRGQHSTIVIKDPRLCLLLPVWQGIVTDPVYVVAVRDPRKIAASLMTAFPDLFTTYFLIALWQKYLQRALADLAGKCVLFVSYERLLENPEAEHRRIWSALGDDLDAGLTEFDATRLRAAVDGALDRSKLCPHAWLNEDQQRLFDWAQRCCEAPGAVVVREVPSITSSDAVLGELEHVRGASMRNGWNLAMRKQAAATVTAAAS